MSDKYFDLCYEKYRDLKKKTGFTAKSKKAMMAFHVYNEDIEKKSTNNNEQTTEELKKVWQEREIVAIDEIEHNISSDAQKRPSESSDNWAKVTQNRREKAKIDSDKRIDLAFDEMYIAGKGKSEKVQLSLLKAWDAFEKAIDYVWEKLTNFFRQIRDWLIGLWDKVYNYIKQTASDIIRHFVNIFSLVI